MSMDAGNGRRAGGILLLLLGIVAVLAAGGLLVGLRAFAAQAPPERLSDAELLSRVAQAPEKAPDFSARMSLEQSLLPAQLLEASGQGEGPAASGPWSARVWYGGEERVRAELQGDGGDKVFVQNGSEVSIYDGATNTLRSGEHSERAERPPTPAEQAVTPAEVDEMLAELAPTSTLAQGDPIPFAGRQAYVLTLRPKDQGSTLVDRAQALIDSETYLPLRFALYAQGRPDPVFAWRVSEFDVGPVPAGVFDLRVPPGAEVEPLDAEGERGAPERGEPVDEPKGKEGAEPAEFQTVAQAQKRTDFEIQELSAPPGGRELTGVYLKGSDGAVLTYGSGWGTIVLAQGTRGEDAAAAPAPVPEPEGTGGDEMAAALPTVSLGGGVEAVELSTPVGSGLRWSEGGVSYVLAGSIPAAELEQAARGLR